MTRNGLRHRLAAATLGLALLAPPAVLAQGGRPAARAHVEPSGLAVLWSFVSGLFTSGETKNRGQIDPNGFTATTDPGDHRGQIDPNGFATTTDDPGDHRGQMDPNG